MRVLMSIKPKYVEKIFSREKLFEFRKTIFKREDIDTIVVYATAPISKIVGEFRVGEIEWGLRDIVWGTKSHRSGMSKEEYYEYFKSDCRCYAIYISDVTLYDKPRDLSEYGIKRPPQNFMYLPE